jgi:poly-gamma-glutamate synthesis protein (capsule biosynthesis protein)
VASAASPARLVQAVKAVRDEADVLVVYLDGGTDYTRCPNARQRRTAATPATAGADVVVGAHAHRVQGSAWRGTTFGGYGLGNLVRWRDREPDAWTGVLTLTLDGAGVAAQDWKPLLVSPHGIPRAPDPAKVQSMHRAWEDARACAGLGHAPGRG